jgi:hypothetical protein
MIRQTADQAVPRVAPICYGTAPEGRGMTVEAVRSGPATPDPSPPVGPPIECLAERVRMALAEAGYPNARVTDTALVIGDGVPGPAIWRAFRVSGGTGMPCLTCWLAGGTPCDAYGEGLQDCGRDRN